MSSILFYNVFDPKIVNRWGELDGYPFVCPKSWHYPALGIFVFANRFLVDYL